jgi:hypothetical protein
MIDEGRVRMENEMKKVERDDLRFDFLDFVIENTL